MKTLMAVILFGSLQVVAFAKDKTEAKPAVDSKTLADLFREQRDYANLSRSVMPQEIELTRREQVIKAKLAEAQKQCGDESKWKLNPVSGECEEVKPPAPPTPETKKENQ